MAFVRIRTIKGKQYRYREERWREGGKVRSRSISLGPVNGSGGGFGPASGDDEPAGLLSRFLPRKHGIDWDAIEQQELARQKTDNARHAALHARLYADYGLKLGPATPVPVEKPAPLINLSSIPQTEENTPPDGEAEVSESQDR